MAPAPAAAHVPGVARLLSQRTVAHGVPPPSMQIAQIAHAVRQYNDGGSVQHLAAHLLRGGALPPTPRSAQTCCRECASPRAISWP